MICAEVVYGHVGWLSSKRWSKKGDGYAAGGMGQVCLEGGLCFLDLWWLHLCRFLFLLVAVSVVDGGVDFVVAAVVPCWEKEGGGGGEDVGCVVFRVCCSSG